MPLPYCKESLVLTIASLPILEINYLIDKILDKININSFTVLEEEIKKNNTNKDLLQKFKESIEKSKTFLSFKYKTNLENQIEQQRQPASVVLNKPW